jgi:hypothetical protein
VQSYGTDPASDWMNATPSDWLDRYVPGWRQTSYGDLMRTRPADWPRWFQSQYAPLAGGPSIYPFGGSSAYPFYGPPKGHTMHHPRGCECRECRRRKGWDCGGRECRHCGCEPCECFCCIGDVDLVVYARVGERRVIPIMVENERRRERSVTVELSNWRTRGGGASLVETTGAEPKTFILPPCSEREITIGVEIREPESAGTPSPEGQRGDRGKPDVDECVVAYADLTLVGCDHRCIRIAIAILPRCCEPFRIGCGCGCC